MLKIAIFSKPEEQALYRAHIHEGAHQRQLEIEILPESAPVEADVIVMSPEFGPTDFSQFPRLKYIQSLWAGADAFLGNPTIKVPLCRLVDRGLEEGMREYVLAYILADHCNLVEIAAAKTWRPELLPPLARSKQVAILGVGVLGQAVGNALAALGFEVKGWATRSKFLAFPVVQGDAGLQDILPKADYIVTLLPATGETRNLVNKQFLNQLNSGAMLINPGRGALVDEEALLQALREGRMRRAVLDVFKIEPLPPEHPFWQEEKITITPHIAAASRPESASEVIVENIARFQAGEPLQFVVDFARGY